MDPTSRPLHGTQEHFKELQGRFFFYIKKFMIGSEVYPNILQLLPNVKKSKVKELNKRAKHILKMFSIYDSRTWVILRCLLRKLLAANRHKLTEIYILLQEAAKKVTLVRAKSQALKWISWRSWQGLKTPPTVFSNRAFREVTLNTHYSEPIWPVKGSHLKPTVWYAL